MTFLEFLGSAPVFKDYITAFGVTYHSDQHKVELVVLKCLAVSATTYLPEFGIHPIPPKKNRI